MACLEDEMTVHTASVEEHTRHSTVPKTQPLAQRSSGRLAFAPTLKGGKGAPGTLSHDLKL